VPRGGVAGCQGCGGRCCHQYVVPVCGYDAYRIAMAELLAIEQFAVALPEEDRTPVGFRLAPGAPTHTLALDRHPEGACTFLVTLADGQGRCGIYAHRPLVCQTYPARLHHGAVDVRDDAMCPPGAWNISGMDLPAWRLSLLRMELEWALYARVVERWNAFAAAGSFSLPAYCGYVMNVYARLEPVRGEFADLDAVLRGMGAPAGDGEAPAWQRFFARADDVIAATLPVPIAG
jgi:Fe-S-cluster containining protein